MREASLGYLFILPAIAAFGIFVFYPLVKTAYLGFFLAPPTPNLPAKYDGFHQYASVLGSAEFADDLGRTTLFVAFTVPLGIILGVALANLAHTKVRGIRIFRTIFSSTVATSVAVASVIFFTLLNPQIGLLSYAFGKEGGNGILASPQWALPAVALTTIWLNLGFTFILMSAALQSLPQEVLEASMVDGASSFTRLRKITLPLLSPILFFAAVIGVISGFQAFGQIDLLTQGGPNHASLTLIYDLYQQAFQFDNPGYAAVLSIALFFILMILTFVQFWFFQRRVSYASG
ncbi:MAG TPA: sugar ABC transporter permease, partial [Acidimicrobiales bacterium]|nr:sugar ABC transporter permease [Acidimicrobiales bacterium]